ncbi:MAG: TIGR00159 family protein [Myxococcales bacterium]|nr:TIGR00159 family protein [Myxococcales bacterium]
MPQIMERMPCAFTTYARWRMRSPIDARPSHEQEARSRVQAEARVPEGLLQLLSTDRSAWETLRDLFDILVVTFLIYRGLLVLKGTRAMQMVLGIVVVGLLYVAAERAQLTTVLLVFERLASAAILIIVVVFQNDIRRGLIRLGAKAWLTRGRDAQERVIDEVVGAASELARHRMGALICLERDANVLEFVKSDGIPLDAEVSRELLVGLFIPEAMNKTHDGAVLIRDLRIARAGMFLPMPEATRVADHSLGSRHRAAIGITEETDAVVVVVSEERGTITMCFPNGMVQNVDGASLKQALLGLFGRGGPQLAKSWYARIIASRAVRKSVAQAAPRSDERTAALAAKAGRAPLASHADEGATVRLVTEPRIALSLSRAPVAVAPESPPARDSDAELLPPSRLGASVPMEPASALGVVLRGTAEDERDSDEPPPATIRGGSAEDRAPRHDHAMQEKP